MAALPLSTTSRRDAAMCQTSALGESRPSHACHVVGSRRFVSAFCTAGAGACRAVRRSSKHAARGTRAVSRASSVPQAVRLVSVKEGQLVIDDASLLRLVTALQASSCTRIAVISIAGALRQGKSFFLDLFARYLESSDGWLAESLQDHQRFHWSSGMERVTEGVWVCPHVFQVPSSDKTRVGILLMDTQGTYEPGATRWQNDSLLGLAGLLSSTLLFNISKQLQEDTVEDLQAAMDMLQMTCRQHGRPPPAPDSKNLTFLVRDWVHADSQQLLFEDDLATSQGLPMSDQEQSVLASFVHSTTAGQGLGQFFESLHCRTLPHPGHIDRPGWTGVSSDVSCDFINKCGMLFNTLADAASAQAGAAIGVQDFEQTLKESVILLNSTQDFTEGKSRSAVLSDLSMLNAMDRARSSYRANMYRAGALMKGKAIPQILLGEVAGTRALVAQDLAAAHRDSVAVAGNELRRLALFSDDCAVAQSASELEEELEKELPRLQEENRQWNQQRLNGLAEMTLAAVTVSGLVPPAAAGIAAVMMPAYALQLWRFKIAGGDFMANSIELHKAMLRTERTWAKDVRSWLSQRSSEPTAARPLD
ncbi:ATL2 [Symbiodinium sp. CCMP2456]|nr:ATL2 [Symbiodinium sp. CCMP2456]